MASLGGKSAKLRVVPCLDVLDLIAGVMFSILDSVKSSGQVHGYFLYCYASNMSEGLCC